LKTKAKDLSICITPTARETWGSSLAKLKRALRLCLRTHTTKRLANFYAVGMNRASGNLPIMARAGGE
jgi:hypothetical protein